MPGIQKRSTIPRHGQQVFILFDCDCTCTRTLSTVCRLCMQRQDFKLMGHGIPFSCFTFVSMFLQRHMTPCWSSQNLQWLQWPVPGLLQRPFFPLFLASSIWSIAAAVGAAVHVRELPPYLFAGRLWQVPNYKGNAMAFQQTTQELRKSINQHGPTY